MILEEAITRYGKIENGVWANEEKWMTNLTLTPPMWPIQKHIYCNKDILVPLASSFVKLGLLGLADQFKTFDGCFNIRDVRGMPGQLSAHAYGLAVDLNASTNQLGTDGDMTPEFVKCFTDEGFTWGGTFKRKDPMHMSRAWE